MRLSFQLLVVAALTLARLAGAGDGAFDVPGTGEPAEPRLSLLAPQQGERFPAPATIEVRAVGVGRYGGITDTEVLLDGEVADESRIRFIRAPEADEPVYHSFLLENIGAGEHTLEVREIENPRLTTGPVTFIVVDGPRPTPGERLTIISPAPGTVFRPGDRVSVEAVGVGRLGGITRVELLLDREPAGRSEIVFVRPPEADEPVQHHFQLEQTPAVGTHRLQVRDLDKPGLVSAEVRIEVVAAPALLRMTSLVDGTLVLFVNAEDADAEVQIESSADLLEWQPVGMVGPALEGPVMKPAQQFAPGGSARFYRAVLAPR